MFTPSSIAAPKGGYDSRREERAKKIKLRVNRVLETFHFLPDVALIDIRTVCVLRGRSMASTWRDVASGQLAAPVKVGCSTRWRVGDVRAALAGARHD
jgi:predicted DNA-binding transcriptional regulator AlpA